MAPSVVEATNVTHSYEGPSGWVHALEGFDLTIPANEFLCILGPSGCGKSTFLRIVAGLLHPTTGTVLFNGRPIGGPGLDRGVVFQEPALFPWLTVKQNVEFGLRMGGWDNERADARARHVLEVVGLLKYERLFPYQLSGGMKHRVAVARGWALESAGLLLMDEPFSAVDAINRMALQDYLVETWLPAPRPVLYITHDIEEAVYLADRVAVVTPSPGRVAATFRIDLPRPRDRNSVAFAGWKARITALMRDIADMPSVGQDEESVRDDASAKKRGRAR